MKIIKGQWVLAIVIMIAMLGTHSQAQSNSDIAKQFAGMWRLVSWPQRFTDGTTRQSPQSFGYVMFTGNYMCYVNMDPNRPKWKSVTPTESEALSSMIGFGAYCARVELRAEEGFLLQHVEIANSPNVVGRVRKRWFTFEGPDRVRLRIDEAELNPPMAESTLIWERMTK
jgi:hypothetical protein